MGRTGDLCEHIAGAATVVSVDSDSLSGVPPLPVEITVSWPEGPPLDWRGIATALICSFGPLEPGDFSREVAF